MCIQTTVLLQDHSERVHLSNGLIAELDVLGVLSLSLDGSLTVSLWNKNAHSLIKNTYALSFRLRYFVIRRGLSSQPIGEAPGPQLTVNSPLRGVLPRDIQAMCST